VTDAGVVPFAITTDSGSVSVATRRKTRSEPLSGHVIPGRGCSLKVGVANAGEVRLECPNAMFQEKVVKDSVTLQVQVRGSITAVGHIDKAQMVFL
jgi:hypothetical protein